ncbi:IclR family transcriptional regulator [Arthrobacter globiformis]|nr:IclR family transcriptional regulator [Arthrobacter globiformis]
MSSTPQEVPTSAETFEVDSGPSRDPLAQRIMAILEACAATWKPVTLTELVESTGLAKSTVHRMSWKLVELGMLQHTEEGFLIGNKMLALANANPVMAEVRALAMPRLLDLQRIAGASQLAVLSDGSALIIDGIYTSQMRAQRLIGRALPLHSTAVGKALLASLPPSERERYLNPALLVPNTVKTIVQPALLRRHLEGIVNAGVAVSNEEHQLGVVGIAAAVRVREGTTVAIGCVGSSSNPAMLTSHRAVRESAAYLKRAFEENEAARRRLTVRD